MNENEKYNAVRTACFAQKTGIQAMKLAPMITKMTKETVILNWHKVACILEVLEDQGLIKYTGLVDGQSNFEVKG